MSEENKPDVIKCVDVEGKEVFRVAADGEVYWRETQVKTSSEFRGAMLELRDALMRDAASADQQELQRLRQLVNSVRAGDPNYVQVPQTFEQAQAMILLADRWIQVRMPQNAPLPGAPAQ